MDARVRNLIVRYATQHGVDPAAALAVASTEGGIKFGAVGDGGTSFGPFQLHVNGALPRGKGAAFANSPEGIDYAIRQMAPHAKGLTGQEAIDAIVRKFERPAAPGPEIAKASSRYSSFTGAKDTGGDIPAASPSAPAAPGGNSFPTGGNLRDMLLAQAFGQSFQPTRAQGSSNPLGSFGNFAGSEALSQPSTAVQLVASRLAQRASQAATATPGGTPGAAPGATTDSGVAVAPSKDGKFFSPLKTPIGSKSEFDYVDAEGAPDDHGTKHHAGKDWFGQGGSPVFAPWGGKVVEVKPSRGNSGQIFGGVVKVQGPDGRVFVARHVDPNTNLQVGQSIKPGTRLAGVTSWADNPKSSHAHIEVWKTLQGGYSYGNMIDPMTLFGR